MFMNKYNISYTINLFVRETINGRMQVSVIYDYLCQESNIRLNAGK